MRNSTQYMQKEKEEVIEEDVKINDRILEDIKEFRGTFFKELIRIGEVEGGEDQLFALFVQKGLQTAGLNLEDPYEQLSLPDFAKVLGRVMEVNNMEELFRAMERLNGRIPDFDRG